MRRKPTRNGHTPAGRRPGNTIGSKGRVTLTILPDVSKIPGRDFADSFKFKVRNAEDESN